MERRFNLVEENWIPVADHGLVSLGRIFQDTDLKALGGDPVLKISVLKLLLAIAQRASTPLDDQEWSALDVEQIAERCRRYLESRKDDFWFVGDRPFLQLDRISKAEIQNYGALMPDISSGNTTVLFGSQIERPLEESEKALALLRVGSFALSGKKTDNRIVLSPGYQGKSATGKAGPGLGYLGYQHSFYLGRTVLETVYLNLLTRKDIADMAMFPEGVGVPPWEEMPQGEDDSVARRLKDSYMGRLVPLSRFTLDTDCGVHFTEGIAHGRHNDGIWDPSVSTSFAGKAPKALWIDPSRRPWRSLTAVLSFMSGQDSFTCYQIKLPYSRVRASCAEVGLWVAGVRVSSNAGEQYCSGTDDYLESSFSLKSEYLGKDWYGTLEREMQALDAVSRNLWASMNGYQRDLKIQNPGQLSKGTSLFWELCERSFQNLVDACGPQGDPFGLRRVFAGHVQSVYDQFCGRESARQIQCWAKNRPQLGKYLAREGKGVTIGQ